MVQDYLLEMKGIVKQYPGVLALSGVDFFVHPGSIHCLVGENGAGKSTLIKILTCAEKMTSGEIFLQGQPFRGRSVRDAMNAGISTVFQELNIINQMTVRENLTLGREKHQLGIIKKDASDPVLRLLSEFAPDIPLDARVHQLSFAEKQIVETVKAIGADARLVIMDEPTASLSERETQRIYTFVKQLKAKGISVIFISHLLEDIFTLGDEVTVMRDGSVVATRPVAETTREELIQLMVGRAVSQGYTRKAQQSQTELLKAQGLCTAAVSDIDFTLHEGEVLGFYGLRGAGKSEIARALYGLDRLTTGQIYLHGQPISVKNPRMALAHGIAMVPEERLSEGLFMRHSLTDNIAITSLKRQSRLGIVMERSKNSIAREYMDRLRVKAHSATQWAGTLSGGNQQKIVIAKNLNAKAKVLLLDEPTRGIDVGSKEEIYDIIRQLSKQGAGILVFSSEYEEIAAVCDRVMLISEGRIIAARRNEELDPKEVRQLTMDKGASA